MKNILAPVFLFLSIASFGQLEKGMFLATGNISFQANDYGESMQAFGSAYKVTQIELSPSIGYMVSPRFAIGLLGNYSRTEQEQNAVNQFSVAYSLRESFGGGLFTRYYQPITDKLYFFAQADVGYAKYNLTQALGTDTEFKEDFSTVRVAVRPGISYFIVKRLAIEVMLGSISYTATSFSSEEDLSGFSFRFLTRGVSPGVTFTF